MIAMTEVCKPAKAGDFLKKAIALTSTREMEDLLSELPIVPEDNWNFDAAHPEKGWQTGKLHWVPVGRERGRAT